MTSPQSERRKRVPAMAPDDRRAALIEATIPLLHEHGLDVSTRRIAEAAGVAEGTIFGVFKDKLSLLTAATEQALDPQPTLDGLAAISAELDLRDRLTLAAELINDRFRANAALMTAARSLVMSPNATAESVKKMVTNRAKLSTAMTDLIEPDRELLRRSPGDVANLLLLFCGANTYGPFGDPDHFDGGEMVSLLLDGLLVVDTGTETMTIPLFAAGPET